MNLSKFIVLSSFFLSVSSFSETKSKKVEQPPTKAKVTTTKGKRMEAVIKTSKGDINIELFGDLTPNTVENFVALAKGTKEWIHPSDRKPQKNVPLYTNVIFHRVIAEFMIQTGDPLGTGTGGPGYTFADEFHPSLKHEKYVLSMANRGPNTNGSQFFITLADTPWLDGKHSIFGKVTDAKSKEVVDSIGSSKTTNDRPVEQITIKEIIIK